MKNRQVMWPLVWLAATAVLVGAVLSSGVSLSSLPLVGGKVSGQTYHLRLELSNALNLPDRAPVQLNGAMVGNVQNIELDGYTAIVDVAIMDSVRLPTETTAQLRRSTPLGDVHIALTAPASGTGRLDDGDRLAVSATGTAPQIEDLISGASLLINGGGLNDVVTIVSELKDLLYGREAVPAALMGDLESLLSVVNDRSADIDLALADADRLADELTRRRPTIKAALRESPKAAKVLADETDDLVSLTARLGKLSDGGNDLLDATSDDVVATIASSEDVLRGLGRIGDDLGPILERFQGLVPVLESVTRGEQLSGTANFTLQPSTINGLGLPTIEELLGLTGAGPGIAAGAGTATTKGGVVDQMPDPDEKWKSTSPSESLVSPLIKRLQDLLTGRP